MNWPDGAKYHVHVFEARPASSPVAVAALFRPTLDMHTGQRLRRSGARNWWVFSAGWWWAKAHDSSFDCEERWAGTELLPAPARAEATTK